MKIKEFLAERLYDFPHSRFLMVVGNKFRLPTDREIKQYFSSKVELVERPCDRPLRDVPGSLASFHRLAWRFTEVEQPCWLFYWDSKGSGQVLLAHLGRLWVEYPPEDAWVNADGEALDRRTLVPRQLTLSPYSVPWGTTPPKERVEGVKRFLRPLEQLVFILDRRGLTPPDGKEVNNDPTG